MRTNPVIFPQRCMSYTLILEAEALAVPHKTNNSNNDNSYHNGGQILLQLCGKGEGYQTHKGI